jgi:hypothetical protein
MKLKEGNILNQWEFCTNRLTDYFVKRYFGKNAEYYFIGNEIGGTIDVCDRFFSLDDMVAFIRYKYTAKQMFEYYDYKLKIDSDKKGYPINIKNWKYEITML